MPVRNAHWYNQNEGRAYPIDDSASAVADDGVRLPSNIITDLSLRWPSTLGNQAFVSAVSNTDALVTLTIQGAGDGAFTPLAVVSVKKPVDEGRVYAVQAQAEGVSGWVVFGSGVTGKTYRGRFGTPAQSLLTSRTARPYRPLPVKSIQARHAEAKLTGVVTLRATEPLEIVKEERQLDGALRDCIVIRLVDGEGAEGFPVPPDATSISGFKQKSVFQQFAGPCAGRPESNTCGCANPIEFVNAVAPDCDGVVKLDFRGCAQVAQIEDGGVAVTCQLGLVDACLPAQIPNSEGLLPSEYEPANVPVPPDVPPDPDPEGVSDSLVEVAELPYLACFSMLSSPLTVFSGTWNYSDDPSPTGVCVADMEATSLSYSVSYSSVMIPTLCADGAPERLTIPVTGGAGDMEELNGEWTLNYAGYDDTTPPAFWYWTGTKDDAPGWVATFSRNNTPEVYLTFEGPGGKVSYAKLTGLSDDCYEAVPLTFHSLNLLTGTPPDDMTVYSEIQRFSESTSINYELAGSYEVTSAGTRNVALFDVDVQSVYRKATTEVKLADGPSGAKRNAQLIVNHRDHATAEGQKVYFVAEIDYDTQEFALKRFNGTTFVNVAPASVTAPGIQLDKWYRITATCLPGGGAGDVTITARLESITEPGVIDVELAATVSNYQPSTGKFGVGTNRAVAKFAYLKIEEAP